MNIYTLKYFKVVELVDRVTYQIYGEEVIKLLNPDLLYSIDGVREFFNLPVTINNWYEGGPFQYRGYRCEDCPVGARNSYHKLGMASDLNVKGLSADEVRKAILANKDNELLSKIMRMEADVTWVHLDIGQVPKGKERIYLFKG